MYKMKQNDDLLRKNRHFASDDVENARSDSGLFIVHFDPKQSLVGTTPACDYGVPVTEADNVGSVLRKNTKDIQSALDDYFGVDESDNSQRVFISGAIPETPNMSACTITYTGYESENEGEVAALVSNQISNVIDKKIRMEWNDDPYPVNDEQLKEERKLEAKRQAMEADSASNQGPVHDANFGKTNVSLDNSLAPSENEPQNSNEMEM